MTNDLTAHWRRAYENKYLGAWDLWIPSRSRYAEVTARIESVSQDEVIGEGGRKSWPIQLHLAGKKGPIATPMIVSKTSGKTLEIMFGPSPSGWVGKEITIYVRQDKRVRKGTGAVLVIRSTRATDDLKEELRRGPAIDEGELEDREEPGQGPGQEG